MQMKRICIVPQVSGVGGMVSFRDKLTVGLESRGYEVVYRYKESEGKPDSILVIGGTKDIPGLLRAKRLGIRIVQRLNGMNWLHRKLKTGVKHYLRAEYGNWVLAFIRAKIADHIIYQSKFARHWWNGRNKPASVMSSVIYNGVDLDQFSPDKKNLFTGFPTPKECIRVLVVEGSLQGGYEVGLESAVGVVRILNSSYRQFISKPVELFVVGQVSQNLKRKWTEKAGIDIFWTGLVPQDQIPALDATSHLLYASDINAACPNSVIEALACGTPVLAFDSGAISELIGDESGKVIPYGGNPWNLDKPDLESLALGGVEILKDLERFRRGARIRAEKKFDLDLMVESYLEHLLH
jgi:glycosyltransferase involved in cell wall biosynthesis